MKEIKRVPFTHNGKQYEVVVALDVMQLKAKAMLNGKPANNFTASADTDTAMDLKSEHELDAIEMIMCWFSLNWRVCGRAVATLKIG